MNSNIGLSGEYNLVITRPDGNIAETGWFSNIILDQGLELMGTVAGVASYCQIGTGSTTPAVTQVALTSLTAGKSMSGRTITNTGAPNYKSIHTISYAFPQGTVVGNMAEIGVGTAATGNTLFSRALITDGVGAPTTLTVLAIDQLTVYYRITITPDLTVANGTVTLGGSTYNYISSIASATTAYAQDDLFINYSLWDGNAGNQGYNSWFISPGATAVVFGTVDNNPTSESVVGNTIMAVSPYTLGTRYRDVTLNLPVGSGNATGGINTIRVHLGRTPSCGNAKYQFTPPIPKDSTKTLSLTFRTSWGRGT